jgi:hypothetical protein
MPFPGVLGEVDYELAGLEVDLVQSFRIEHLGRNTFLLQYLQGLLDDVTQGGYPGRNNLQDISKEVPGQSFRHDAAAGIPGAYEGHFFSRLDHFDLT